MAANDTSTLRNGPLPGKLEAELEARQDQQQAEHAERAGGGDLAAHDCLAAGGRGEQRLEGLAFALARSDVDHQVSAAQEGAENQEVGQEGQHHAAPGLGRRQVAPARDHGFAERRIHAAREQAQRRDLAAVAAERILHADDRDPRILPRAVVEHLDERGPALVPAARILRRNTEDHLVGLVTNGGLGVLRRIDRADIQAVEEGHQVRGVGRADHRQVERALELGARSRFRQRSHAQDEHGEQQRSHEQAQHQRAPVAEQVEQLLAHHRPDRIHADKPSSEPIRRTNASSRFCSPLCCLSSSALPCAITCPWR
jgi:hypothetical protein